jgi:L-asparaginase II
MILAEILRGGHVESRHTGSFAVTDAQGRLVLSGGDPHAATFPRSAIKALQALPLLAEGAADRFGLTDAQLALACASHTGLPAHTETARAMLTQAGREPACLECGTHWPSSVTAARALAAAGETPTALHNNCSGKHAGFVCAAISAGHDPRGYIRPDHPTMVRVTQAVREATGAAMAEDDRATDGCSIPTYRMKLSAIATGFARLGTGTDLPQGFSQAATRLRSAAAANPVMLGGPGRIDTEITKALGEAAFIKTGAEGVHAGAIPALGLGFAIKADDGGNRASDAFAAALLRHFLPGYPVLDAWACMPLTNWNGLAVGEICATGPNCSKDVK